MIESYYGLRADPFPLSPDHSESFLHDHFVKARDYIDYALLRGDGIVMITGRPGTGKTTLVKDLESRVDRAKVKVIVLVTTQLEAEDLLRMVAYGLGLNANAPNKALLLHEIMRCLEELASAGRRALLVIDEAQDLAASALEELRLLTNLERAGRPMLQIMLLGQQQLRERIRQPEMEQVQQRVIAAWNLEPLSPSETIRYVSHRLRGVGWTGRPSFASGVLGVVYSYSGGTPRLINLICSRLLLRGIVTGKPEISFQDADLVMAELRDEALTLPHGGDTALARDPGQVLSEPLPALTASSLPISGSDPQHEPAAPASVPPIDQSVDGVVSAVETPMVQPVVSQLGPLLVEPAATSRGSQLRIGGLAAVAGLLLFLVFVGFSSSESGQWSALVTRLWHALPSTLSQELPSVPPSTVSTVSPGQTEANLERADIPTTVSVQMDKEPTIRPEAADADAPKSSGAFAR